MAATWRASTSVGVGLLGLRAAADVPASALVGVVAALRAAAADAGGAVVVREAPAEVRAELDVWGEIGPALPLMRAVKDAFDPARTLAPGRFVGGL